MGTGSVQLRKGFPINLVPPRVVFSTPRVRRIRGIGCFGIIPLGIVFAYLEHTDFLLFAMPNLASFGLGLVVGRRRYIPYLWPVAFAWVLTIPAQPYYGVLGTQVAVVVGAVLGGSLLSLSGTYDLMAAKERAPPEGEVEVWARVLLPEAPLACQQLSRAFNRSPDEVAARMFDPADTEAREARPRPPRFRLDTLTPAHTRATATGIGGRFDLVVEVKRTGPHGWTRSGSLFAGFQLLGTWKEEHAVVPDGYGARHSVEIRAWAGRWAKEPQGRADQLLRDAALRIDRAHARLETHHPPVTPRSEIWRYVPE